MVPIVIIIIFVILFVMNIWMLTRSKREEAVTIKEAIKYSDDLNKWSGEFLEAASWLIWKKLFTLEDFQFHGGWCRSSMNGFKNSYFVYPANNPSVKNKIYLDVTTGMLYHYYNRHTSLVRKARSNDNC